MNNTLSEEAIASDAGAKSQLFPVNKIYSDTIFNSRGTIAPIDVLDLAQDVAKNGLINPITIRPRRSDDRCGPEFEYVLIAGHRRHLAYRVNKAEFIPAILREETSPLEEARINAIENLKRSDLNMLQEALMIQKFVQAGFTDKRISETLGVSANWVNVRRTILTLDPLIQQEIAAGWINQNQIKEIAKANTSEKRFEFVRKIKEAKQKGETVKVLESKAPVAFSKSARKQHEIQDLLIHIMDNIGACFASRVLAWAAGNINNLEVYEAIKEEAGRQGKPYTMPELEYKM